MEDLLKLKVSELRKKCKDLGLSLTGNKAELITRIQEHINKGGDDSVLNEAELLGELDGLDTQVVSNVDEDLLLGDSISESKEESETNIKVSMESNEKLVESQVSEKVEEPPAKLAKLDITTSKEKVIISKTELTIEQKKQERAARFGISNQNKEDEKKIARAQRFGLELPKTNGDATIDLEKLKKREERFGVSVSDKLKKASEEEKKQKRAERFGIQQISTEKTNNDISNDDKKSIRAKRFGINSDNDKKQARAAKFGK